MQDNSEWAESTKVNKLRATKKFLQWLYDTDRYLNITKEMINYLSPVVRKRKSNCITEDKATIAYEDFSNVFDSCKVHNEVTFRNKALLGFTICTGARIGAVVSMPLKSYISEEKKIIQNPD